MALSAGTGRTLIVLALIGVLSACGGATSELPSNATLRAVALDRVSKIGQVAPAAPSGGGGPETVGPAPAASPEAIRAALTPQVIAQFPAPTLFAVLNGAVSLPQQIAVTNGVATWLTEDNATLSTRDGLLISSRGLGFDLMESDTRAARAAISAGRGTARRSHAWLDGEGALVTVVFECSYAAGGSDVIETCRAGDLAFENRYTLRSGEIEASRQWLGPVLGYIAIEFL